MHPDSATRMNEYRRQLLAPDFDGFEAHFGCLAPPELRQFYELKERLLGGPLYATIRIGGEAIRIDLIQYAQPMTHSNWSYRYGTEYFRFAVNTDGYPLLVKPSSARSPVFADWEDHRPTPDIDPCDFTLWEIVGTLGDRD